MASRPSPLDRTLGPAIALLVGLLVVFEALPIDLRVQDLFFDFTTGRWLVDGQQPLGRLLWYNGPKAVIILVALALLVLALGPRTWRDRARFGRRELSVAVLTLVSVPFLAGLGKATTNTFCPSEVRRYGGDVPYVKLLSSYPAEDRPPRRGRGFPAGHASGGFALVALAWLRPGRRWRVAGIGLALGVGWWMGTYQMLKGAHYLSHTLATMLLAWIVALAWRRALRCAGASCAPA